MVTTNYTFSKIFRLLPSSVASIVLSHMYIILIICTFNIYIYILKSSTYSGHTQELTNYVDTF